MIKLLGVDFPHLGTTKYNLALRLFLDIFFSKTQQLNAKSGVCADLNLRLFALFQHAKEGPENGATNTNGNSDKIPEEK
jgi:hypothetical protein